MQPGPGPGFEPGVHRDAELHLLRAGRSRLGQRGELDGEAGSGHAETGERGGDLGGQPHGAVGAHGGEASRRIVQGLLLPLDLAFQLVVVQFRAVQARQLGSCRDRRAEHVLDLGAVLAPQALEQVLPAPDLIEARRVLLDPAAVAAHLAAELLETVEGVLHDLPPGLEGRIDADDLLEAAPDFREACGHGVLAGVEFRVETVRQAGQLAGVGEPPCLHLQVRFLARPRTGALDLIDLEPKEIRPLFRRPDLRLKFSQPGAGATDAGMPFAHLGGEIRGARPGIQQRALLARVQERLVLVLAVQVHQVRTELTQERHCRRRAIHPDAAAATGRNFTPQDEMSVLRVDAVVGQNRLDSRQALHIEYALHLRPGRARSHRVGRRPLAEKQRERAHDDGLPRPRLAGEDMESLAQLEGQPIDDGVIADAKFGKHVQFLSAAAGAVQ
jgi:hypothetical protein